MFVRGLRTNQQSYLAFALGRGRQAIAEHAGRRKGNIYIYIYISLSSLCLKRAHTLTARVDFEQSLTGDETVDHGAERRVKLCRTPCCITRHLADIESQRMERNGRCHPNFVTACQSGCPRRRECPVFCTPHPRSFMPGLLSSSGPEPGAWESIKSHSTRKRVCVSPSRRVLFLGARRLL